MMGGRGAELHIQCKVLMHASIGWTCQLGFVLKLVLWVTFNGHVHYV